MKTETLPCTWCNQSGRWAENRQIVPCKKCNGTGQRHGYWTEEGDIKYVEVNA